jgi:hypothetical protein
MEKTLPGDVKSLSSAWLSHVLQAPVSGFTVLDAHAGTTGRALIALQYSEDQHALPPRLFLKLPPTDEQQRAFVTSSGMGRREAQFYSSLSDELPVRVPHCYFAASDESGEQYIMLLENLVDSGCTFGNARQRYSLHYVRQVLTAFARLHAAYWASPRFGTDLAWLQPPVQHSIAKRLIQVSLHVHASTMPPVFTHMAELYLAETDAIHQLWACGAPTLIHGDVHDGNLFYDKDQPGLLDWAMVARGPAMRDVGYFLAGTLTQQDQRAAAPELIEYYHRQLLDYGAAAPSVEALWEQYQWHSGYVWLGAAVTLAMGDAWQPVSYVQASLQRLHATMEHIGTVGAIRLALRH